MYMIKVKCDNLYNFKLQLVVRDKYNVILSIIWVILVIFIMILYSNVFKVDIDIKYLHCIYRNT